ncbi:MAG: thiamine-phosphate kinase [Candidatus Bathyarchaeia archaeon]
MKGLKRVGGTVGHLGEREVIEVLRKRFDVMPASPLSRNDDVCGVVLDDGRIAVLKTDMLVGKTDVPTGMSLWQAARKAVVMAVSDFAAKGVVPKVALVALGLPRHMLQRDVEEVARGLNAGARQYGVYIIGGDTGEASDLIISVSLFGVADKDALMLRSGARVGDVVGVTGFFGKSAAGLRVLLDGCAVSKEQREVLVGAVFMPQARLKEGLALSASGAVSAAIDSSDGLAWSLHELAQMSRVGFLVDSLPVAHEVKRFAEFNRLDALELALYGGEEYELVVTVKPKLWAVAEKAVKAVGGCLLPIGRVTRNRQVILVVNGEKRLVERRGWEHFKSRV